MRHFLVITLALVSTVLAACGDSTGPSRTGTTGIAGTYNLQTVNGSPLPYTVIQVGQDKLEVTAGRVTLTADRTFSASITFRETENGTATTTTETDSGTYTQNGTAINFAYADGTTDTAALNGNILTIAAQGIALVFRR